MHTLFPPLHEDAGEGLEMGEGINCDGRGVRDRASSSALSEDLRANFDALRSIVHAEQCLDEQPDNERENLDLDNHEQQTKSDKASKKRKAPRDGENRNVSNNGDARVTQRRELQKRKFDLAVATAISVEGEISRLANGIAELEALLRAQENDGAAPGPIVHMPDATFPFLPLVVPPDDEYDNRNKNSAHKDTRCVGNPPMAEESNLTTNTQEKDL